MLAVKGGYDCGEPKSLVIDRRISYKVKIRDKDREGTLLVNQKPYIGLKCGIGQDSDEYTQK